jgi:hypothetical protein
MSTYHYYVKLPSVPGNLIYCLPVRHGVCWWEVVRDLNALVEYIFSDAPKGWRVSKIYRSDCNNGRREVTTDEPILRPTRSQFYETYLLCWTGPEGKKCLEVTISPLRRDGGFHGRTEDVLLDEVGPPPSGYDSLLCVKHHEWWTRSGDRHLIPIHKTTCLTQVLALRQQMGCSEMVKSVVMVHEGKDREREPVYGADVLLATVRDEMAKKRLENGRFYICQDPDHEDVGHFAVYSLE